MAFSGFPVRLAALVALIVGLSMVIARLSLLEDVPMATLVAVVALGAAAGRLWWLVDRTNRELFHFVTALERAELGLSFRDARRGAGFDQVAAAYDRVVERLRAERAGGVGAAAYADALVDGSPTALLVLGPGDEVRFANRAARALFGRAAPATLDGLVRFGAPLVGTLRTIAPGGAAATRMVLDGLSQRVALDATAIETASGRRRIVSLRVIQHELEEAELAVQGDLVRVLTHEVMNSLTPVSSLAGTAARLIGEVDPAASPAIGKARRAIDALARRAGELERFVGDYREFSASPTLRRSSVNVASWFAEIERLFASTPAASGVRTIWPGAAALGTVSIDRALMTQVMLNILKNAGEAVVNDADGEVRIEAARQGEDLCIAVSDNGPGLDPAIAADVFLPFFTTRANGTGIGLSLARKIVQLHGGRIAFVDGAETRLRILLPGIPHDEVRTSAGAWTSPATR